MIKHDNTHDTTREYQNTSDKKRTQICFVGDDDIPPGANMASDYAANGVCICFYLRIYSTSPRVLAPTTPQMACVYISICVCILPRGSLAPRRRRFLDRQVVRR